MPKELPAAAKARLFDRVFICMKCNAKIRADPIKVKMKRIKCRKCGRKDLRTKNRVIRTK